jgi:hypothetical protein
MVADTKLHCNEKAAKWLYHGFGSAVNFIPVVGEASTPSRIDGVPCRGVADQCQGVRLGRVPMGFHSLPAR